MINSDRYELGYPFQKIEWLCPALEKSVRTLQSYQDKSISPSELAWSKQLCERVSENEEALVEAFIESVNQFVGVMILATPKSIEERKRQADRFANSTHKIYANNGPDGYAEDQRAIVIIVKGRKLLEGQYGNPQIQISFDYAKVAKRMDSSRLVGFLPCLLLCLDGNQFSVGLGATYHEFTTQFFIERISMENNNTAIAKCAQALVAVRECVELLRTCYTSAVVNSPCFPRMSYTDNLLDQEVHLQGIAKVSFSKSVYVATASPPSLMEGHVFCVKYASTYCTKLHQLLASKQLAPVLHSSRPVGKDVVIVMDWIVRCLPEESVELIPLQAKVQIAAKLRLALCLMKQNNFVHGDLRSPNIAVSLSNNGDDAEVKIIDFDFGGRFGSAQYPQALDHSQFPWLLNNDDPQSGQFVRYEDDANAIQHYISSVLLLDDFAQMETFVVGEENEHWDEDSSLQEVMLNMNLNV